MKTSLITQFLEMTRDFESRMLLDFKKFQENMYQIKYDLTDETKRIRRERTDF